MDGCSREEQNEKRGRIEGRRSIGQKTHRDRQKYYRSVHKVQVVQRRRQRRQSIPAQAVASTSIITIRADGEQLECLSFFTYDHSLVFLSLKSQVSSIYYYVPTGTYLDEEGNFELISTDTDTPDGTIHPDIANANDSTSKNLSLRVNIPYVYLIVQTMRTYLIYRPT